MSELKERFLAVYKETVTREGSDSLRVVRKNFKSPLTPEQQAHPSETALDDVEPDYYITNNGSMTDLKRNVIDWLVEYLGSHQMTIDEL